MLLVLLHLARGPASCSAQDVIYIKHTLELADGAAEHLSKLRIVTLTPSMMLMMHTVTYYLHYCSALHIMLYINFCAFNLTISAPDRKPLELPRTIVFR